MRFEGRHYSKMYLSLSLSLQIFSYGMQNELHMDHGLIKKVFPMLDEIVDIASKFYDKLQKRQKEAEVIERIGDILVDQVSQSYNHLCFLFKLAILKGSFNNVKSDMHGPTCYQCLWYGVILKPSKICASKWSRSASKK